MFRASLRSSSSICCMYVWKKPFFSMNCWKLKKFFIFINFRKICSLVLTMNNQTPQMKPIVNSLAEEFGMLGSMRCASITLSICSNLYVHSIFYWANIALAAGNCCCCTFAFTLPSRFLCLCSRALAHHTKTISRNFLNCISCPNIYNLMFFSCERLFRVHCFVCGSFN